ncbi:MULTISPECIES: YcgL domain-containing protein [Halomonadaceae]|uniref:YcgL domain-containing protein L0635_00150 n=1 Tax=Vreelandella janggokensis TaxID=370767 RepID=A0ABT4IP97_9GAMM|nr:MULTISPECIES: YcgL domain-containing protein [Halomonas]MCW4152357.1 YcgL domain-containing protein [Halomonas sp. 18H]MCZ0925498.1 YcgL domain-containing protein [Halomonas janggokensis]MCZ0931493.1 YcgL domain-containing protein [Halomonas janggokensis]MDR5886991.1 YcgL domain-containing protein [Halomonas janggokensis]
MSDKLLCEIFKSSRKEEMYLYVDKRQGLTHVPEPLLTSFGKPQALLTMILTADKKLARASAADIIEAIDSQGFYLQMPPGNETNLLTEHLAQQRSGNPSDE